jgi:hypothetical protein
MRTNATRRLIARAIAAGWLILAGLGHANDRPEGLLMSDPICTTPPGNRRLAPGNPAPGTRRMVALLQDYYKNPQPGALVYRNDRMVDLTEEQLASATDPSQRIRLLVQLAEHQTKAGRPDLAILTLANAEQSLGNQGDLSRIRREIGMLKAVAFLRLGEQENCLVTDNPDSCVFPLLPRAYHLLPRGSRGAIAVLGEHLKDYPDDMSARWLLNLAHMTLGEYPARVPLPVIIPPRVFASEHDLPRFIDASQPLAIDVDSLAGGAIVDDFDNDGRYDLFVSAWDDEGQLRFFHHNKNGTFTERTSESGLVGIVGALNIQQTDYNNDGWLDVWLLRGGWLGTAGRLPNSLLRNNGDGTFTDVTADVGLLSLHPTQASRWFDFDGDGWLDLFVGNESMNPDDPDPCELYRNNRDGTFSECAVESGIRIARFVKGVACADYNNDGRPDLFLSVRNGLNVLLRNDGPTHPSSPAPVPWKFTDVTEPAGLADEMVPGFGTFFFDYDNDGWEDLIVFGYELPNGVGDVAADYLGLPNPAAKPRLYRNNRDGTFRNVTRQMRLQRVCHAMGHNYGDLDNDGWLDFYAGTGDPDLQTLIPNRMFRNDQGRQFQDVTTTTGTGHLQKGHGVAFADMDNDGDQDVYVVLGGAFTGDTARNALFLNPIDHHRWLKLQLVGVRANRPAIGARVRVTVRAPNGDREIHRTVSSGGSFGSNPLRQEIGLGDATAILGVTVLWPGSGKRQELTGLALDQTYEIREDDNQIKVLSLR